MARIRAPTLLRLIALGFLVIGLPLIIAIVTAIIQVDGLARESREALVSVQQNTSISRALADRVRELERTARQYQALSDTAYKDLYYRHRSEVRALLRRLMALNSQDEIQVFLEQAEESEIRANNTFESIGRGKPDESLEAVFSALRDDVLVVVQRLNVQAAELSNAMPERADALQRLLVGQAALVIPLSVALALLFGTLVSRSVGQIDRVIRALGRGALSEPIRVKGTSDLEELGQRLEWLRIRLIELEAQKAEFLRNVSHELKTPLTNIREGTQLLLDHDGKPGDAEERHAIASILRSNSIRLQQMIEELLRYGADGAFTPGQTCETVQLDKLVAEAIDRVGAARGTQQMTLKSLIAPAVVEGNAKRLQVIVDNLLSNAVKYSSCGGEISVDLRTDNGTVNLDVRDSGPGIREEDAPHIFEWFYKGPQPANSVIAGTGMGLAIAQEYAQQHDGRILLLPSSSGAHFRLTMRGKSDDEA